MTKRDCTTQNKPNQVKKRVTNTKSFIAKARSTHGERYDYSKVVYVRNNKHVVITCKEHGDFLQTPNSHSNGQGCPACGNQAKGSSKLLTIDDFKARAKVIHKDRYCYSKVDYKNSSTHVLILCKKHGEFLQKPSDHLSGRGCRKCTGLAKSNTPEFIEKARAIHGDRYDYSLVEYKTNKIKVKIVCREHGEFLQTPNSHLSGASCVKCKSAMNGWNRSHFENYCDLNGGGLGLLYVIRCKKGNEVFYKIGITSRTMSLRFKDKITMPYHYTNIFMVRDRPNYIYNLETRLHHLLKNNRHTPSVRFAGDTECFTTIKPIEKLLKELSTTEQLQLLA